MKLGRFLRSPEEVRFRLVQEGWNAWALLRPPREKLPQTLPRLFPDPRRLLGEAPEAWRKQILTLAEQICDGEIPLLGTSVEFDVSSRPAEDWRRDLVNGPISEAVYFRQVPYLDAERVGDHKVIWELSRHQHLVVLAQASLLDPDNPLWLEMLEASLKSWWEGNPFHRGINWASALEVAFRALSWMWILHFAGERLTGEVRGRLIEGLYRHGSHLEHNLSVYFSPNTHLLGEAVCLHALGQLFAALPAASRWRDLGDAWVQRSLETQVLPDGAYFEQSSYYHVYAVDFFLLHAQLAPVSDAYLQRVRHMCSWLARLLDAEGVMPLFGDDDGGRLFHPYGVRRRFGRATLTMASVYFSEPAWGFTAGDYAEVGLWWLGGAPKHAFPGGFAPSNGVAMDSGVALLGDHDTRVCLCARAFGSGQAGHSHAHALQVLLRHAGRDLLIDSGTYTYVGDPAQRERFRGSRAHNTFCVDGDTQATAIGAFQWSPDRSQGSLETFTGDSVTASYRPAAGTYRLTRALNWDGQQLVCVDRAEGKGTHRVEQFWHCPPGVVWDESQHRLRWPSGAELWPDPQLRAELVDTEWSEALYQKSPARCLRLWGDLEFPVGLTARLFPSQRNHAVFADIMSERHP